MSGRIWVFGSLNADLVAEVERQPNPGETLTGGDLQVIPGGKGANQAVAASRVGASRVGAEVRMVGAVGNDGFADLLLESLRASGVDASRVRRTDQATGTALITVARSGENAIVISPGANASPTPESVEADLAGIGDGDFLLCQLESPLEAVEAALRFARRAGARTMLDPAPACELPRSLLAEVDVLTPNESEAAFLVGDGLSLDEQASALQALGPRRVCLKLGSRGFYLDELVPAFEVPVVDTTAAGDVLNAALAVAMMEDLPLRFAAAAAAISVSRKGAQPSAPTRAEAEALLP